MFDSVTSHPKFGGKLIYIMIYSNLLNKDTHFLTLQGNPMIASSLQSTPARFPRKPRSY